MSTSIFMDIIDSKGHYLKEDIFRWHSQKWFNNLRKCGDGLAYKTLPAKKGLPNVIPKALQTAYQEKENLGYYDFFYFSIKDFFAWYEAAEPDIQRGYVSSFDEYFYYFKKILPTHIYSSTIGLKCPSDYHYIKIIDPYEWGGWLYRYLHSLDLSEDSYVVYHFKDFSFR